MSEKYPHTVTYWAPNVPDGYGNYTFAAPSTIDGRWEDKQELYVDADGQEKTSQAKVFVDTDLSPNGYLFFGTSVEANPTSVDGAFRIGKFSKIHAIGDDTWITRTAWLSASGQQG